MNDKAHSLNNGAVDPFRVRHCFVGCHISSQMLLVHAAECSQVRAQSGACSLTAIAMDLANAISIIISGPLSTTVVRSPMFDRRVVGLEFCFDCRIPTPLICVEDRRSLRHRAPHDLKARRGIRMMPDKVAHSATLASYYREDRWPICFIRTVPFALVGSFSGRILRIFVRVAFFPPRSGTVHPPRRLSLSADPKATAGVDSIAPVCESRGCVLCRLRARARVWRSARPWRSRAGARQFWKVADVSSRRPSLLELSDSSRNLYSGRLSACRGGEPHADPLSHIADIAAHQDVDIAPATQGKLARQEVRQSGNQSYSESNLLLHSGDT
jgi:hypothetical protein